MKSKADHNSSLDSTASKGEFLKNLEFCFFKINLALY